VDVCIVASSYREAIVGLSCHLEIEAGARSRVFTFSECRLSRVSANHSRHQTWHHSTDAMMFPSVLVLRKISSSIILLGLEHEHVSLGNGRPHHDFVLVYLVQSYLLLQVWVVFQSIDEKLLREAICVQCHSFQG